MSEKLNPVLIIPKCNITKAYWAEKSASWYLTLQDGENVFNVKTEKFDENKIPLLVPLRVEMEIGAFVYEKNQNLRALSIKAVPV